MSRYPTGTGTSLELQVAGLFGPYPAHHKPPGVDAPGLEALLLAAKAIAPSGGGDPLRQRLSGFVDQDRLSESAPIPVAALERSAQPDGDVAAGVSWMRCDPVLLRADRDRLLMFDAAEATLQMDEAQGLVATLNQTYADDGWWFEVHRPDAWHLRTSAPVRARFTEPHRAIGRPVEGLLPRGEDARFWMMRLNEIQMLFHDHPVNHDRERRGLPAINALWPWGAGAALQLSKPALDVIWDDDSTGEALAHAVGIVHRPTPGSALDWLENAGAGAHRVCLDTLRRPFEYGDFTEWLACLPDLDRAWFQPLERALLSGALRTLTVVDGLWRVEIGPGRGFWRFWRRRTGIMDRLRLEMPGRGESLP